MKAAIYARVSDPGTEKDPIKRELKKKQDTNNQLLPLREFVKVRGWDISDEYVDEISAVKLRPEFNRMMQDAFSGKFKILVTVKIDRVARSVRDFVGFLEKMTSRGIRFIATTQSIDTQENNAASEFLVNMLSAVAQFERQIISERVKAGLARVKAQGGTVGGRKPVIIDAPTAIKLMQSGLSLRQVAEKLGVKKSVLYERVSKYKGTSGVYAVWAESKCLVKIGSCNSLSSRVSQLETETNGPVILLAFIPEATMSRKRKEVEMDIHDRLRPFVVMGKKEWYTPTSEVSDILGKMRLKTPEGHLTEESNLALLRLAESYLNEKALDEFRGVSLNANR